MVEWGICILLIFLASSFSFIAGVKLGTNIEVKGVFYEVKPADGKKSVKNDLRPDWHTIGDCPFLQRYEPTELSALED